MKEALKSIARFNTERGWDKDDSIMKDLLLNICEEATEAWSVIKWVDIETQKKLMQEHKGKFEDFVGDQLFLILKIAWLLDIDADKALEDTIKEYEDRFPVKEVLEAKHGNPLAGGIDDKKDNQR